MIWLKGLNKISESVIELSLGSLSHSTGSIKQIDLDPLNHEIK